MVAGHRQHTPTYTLNVYEADPDEGGYWAEIVELPGCVAQGETLDETRTNALDAIEAWLEAAGELDDDEQPRKLYTTMTLPVPDQDNGLAQT